MNNDAEIIKCLFEQINLMQDLLEDKIMQEGARIVAEINMHKRDKHLEYWDPTYYLEYGKTQREKISDLHKKMGENKKKIAELIKASNEDDSSGDINKDHEIAGYPSPTA